MMTRRAALHLGWGTALLVGLAALAQAPSVTKVEPPNWWVGHSHNPIRLLLTGEHLAGADLVPACELTAQALRISHVKASANGQYLFATVEILPAARPGPVNLQVTHREGHATAPFELLRPLARAGRFQGFSPDDVMYLAMIDRFANGDLENDQSPASPGLLDRSKPRHYHGGDFQGIKDRLDYLQDLGITALWLTPWYNNANELNHLEKYTADNKLSPDGVPSTDYHGYGAVDFYATEDRFGDLETLRRLVARAQAKSIKMIQDQVANHTGPLHPWATNPPTPTWFNGTVDDHLANEWHTWTVTVSNPPPDKLRSTLEGWFINILPDLNQNDPETATYLIQNSLWWVGQTGLDAIRQDTLPYVPRGYWAQWTAALKREYPQLTVLGEMWDGNPRHVAFFQGGRAQFDGVDSGIDTLFDFPMFYAIRDVFAKGQPMTRLTDTLAADHVYVDASVLVTFLGLHDTARFLHEDGATVEGLKLAFTYLLTTRGTPLIYYGDEIGMTGGGDPYNRAGFPGGWPDDPQNAFTREGRTPQQERIHSHVRRLTSLRRELEPLRRGTMRVLAVDRDTHAFARVTPGGEVIVALNNAASPRQLTVPVESLGWNGGQRVMDRLGGLEVVTSENRRLQFTLPARAAAILTPAPAIVQGRAGELDDHAPALYEIVND